MRNFKLFCTDTYDEELHDVLTQMKAEEIDGMVFNLLNDFNDWMSEDHPKILWKHNTTQMKGSPLKKKSVKSMRDHVSFVRKYIKQYYSLKVDMMIIGLWDYLVNENDEESEPLEGNELQLNCVHITDTVHKNKVMMKKDTAIRIKEMIQAQKRHFDTVKRPITLILPKSEISGKRSGEQGQSEPNQRRDFSTHRKNWIMMILCMQIKRTLFCTKTTTKNGGTNW